MLGSGSAAVYEGQPYLARVVQGQKYQFYDIIVEYNAANVFHTRAALGEEVMKKVTRLE